MRRYRTALLSAGILLLSFVLCRFAFFDLHRMKDWPVVLLIAGGAILGVSALFSGAGICPFLPPWVIRCPLPRG